MSVIWENEEIKEKLLRLPPEMQEAFLRSIDRLYKRESQLMLNFIGESRWELRDTQDEIEKEQAVLRDTSDLLASKRFFATEDAGDEFKDKSYEELAVQNYLRSKAKPDGSRLVHTASIIEEILDDTPKAKSHRRRTRPDDRPARKESPTLAWVESEESGRAARRRDAADGGEVVGKATRKKAAADEHPYELEHEPSPRKEEKNRRASRQAVAEQAIERADGAGSGGRDHNRARGAVDQAQSTARHRAQVHDSRASVASAAPRTLEEESEEMVRQYMERDKSSVDSERLKQDEMMKQRREQKKTKHADMAEQLLLQAKLHEEASNKDKEAIEQKMKERLEQRRRREGLSSADTPVAGVHERVVGERGEDPGRSTRETEDEAGKRRKPKKAIKEIPAEQEEAAATALAPDQSEGADEESGRTRGKKKKKKAEAADVDQGAVAAEDGDEGGASAEQLAEEQVQDRPRGKKDRKSKLNAVVADDDEPAAASVEDETRRKKKNGKSKAALTDDASEERSQEVAASAADEQKKRVKKSTRRGVQAPIADWNSSAVAEGVAENDESAAAAAVDEADETHAQQQRRKKKKAAKEAQAAAAAAAEDEVAGGGGGVEADESTRDGDDAMKTGRKKKKKRRDAEAAVGEERQASGGAAGAAHDEYETSAQAADRDDETGKKNRRSKTRKPVAEGDELGDDYPGVHQSRDDGDEKKRTKKKKEATATSNMVHEDGEQELEQVAEYDGSDTLAYGDRTKKPKKKKKEHTSEE